MVGASGEWSIELSDFYTEALPRGEHTVQVWTTDALGRQVASQPVKYRVSDDTPPVVDVDKGDPAVFVEPGQAITGTASDNTMLRDIEARFYSALGTFQALVMATCPQGCRATSVSWSVGVTESVPAGYSYVVIKARDIFLNETTTTLRILKVPS